MQKEKIKEKGEKEERKEKIHEREGGGCLCKRY